MGSKKFILSGLMLGLLLGTLSTQAGIRTVTSRGNIYVPLNNIADYYGMKISQSGKDRIRVRSQWNTLEFETNGRRCWINNTLLWLNHPSRKIGWQWAIEDDDFNKLIDPAIRPYAFLKNKGSQVIVLDPGHGGKDLGAVSPRKVYEKLLVMDVAKRVRNQ